MYRRKLQLLICVILTTAGTGIACAQTNSEIIELENPVGPGKITVQPLSPVDYFRYLLSLKGGQRDAAMAGRTQEQKKVLNAKLHEYEVMPPDLRELRLRHTQLRWHLLALMPMPQKDRSSRLNLIAPEDRPAIEERLRRWDALSPELRQQFLANQEAIARYLEQTPHGETNKTATPTPDRSKQLEQELARWESMPTAQREQMCNLFRVFFEYSAKEKNQTLDKLPEAQRRIIETAMREYASLPADQRQKRLESLRKLMDMPTAERQRFLENAARWQAMTPAQRELWRKTVTKLPPAPPMPPGLVSKLPPTPPMPPGFESARQRTNSASAK